MHIVLRTSVTALACLAIGSGVAGAVGGGEGAAEPGLETADGPVARAFPAVSWNRAPAAAVPAWTAFAGDVGGDWEVLWDRDTGVPSRILGSGVPVPGSMASPAIAEDFARGFLARHIDLLAPGSRIEDFEVVSDHLGGGMRTIGMEQRHHGMAVIGGQVSFRFKNDRMFVIGSEALPHVSAPEPLFTADPAVARDSALAWIVSGRPDGLAVAPGVPGVPGGATGATGAAAASGAGRAWVSAVDGPLVLPIISRRGVAYHTVTRVTVEAREPLGRWQVYVDAATGDNRARQQTLRFADGTLRYTVPTRYPGAGDTVTPARDTAVTVDGVDASTSADGLVSWPGDQPSVVETSVHGAAVVVVNARGVGEATAQLTLPAGGVVTWGLSGTETMDAQVTTFIHSRIVKDYTRTFADNADYLEYADSQLIATVNMPQTCNAYSDGQTINFFRADENCENTARIADVVYHEYGHAMHVQSIIRGVGSFDGAFSEGLADYLAATITNDSAMARGFFRTDEPLRELDPDDGENHWPEDIGGVHKTGIIFGGAMWDLRSELIAATDYATGVAHADRLFYAAVQRATSIPATYAEILAADDDDGDLSNGTPNECLINDTFGRRHGLRDLSLDFVPVGPQATDQDGYAVDLRVDGLTDRCPGDDVVAATLHWGLRGEDTLGNQIALEAAGEDLGGVIPRQAEGTVVRYRISVELSDGSVWTFPSNLADPAYEFFVGDVVELYCHDFETNPFEDGWAHDAIAFDDDPDKDDWEWGPPMPVPGSVDPPAAFSGTGVLGTNLSGELRSGKHLNQMQSYARTPLVEVGPYSDVRLHYRRWLTVEDALYDQATIYANDDPAWVNYDTEGGTTHHLDTEWVFHDVALSRYIPGGLVQVVFELDSDEGLEFGGWTLDDVCIVALASAVCGDGELATAEQCDDGDGNDDVAPDACRTNCRLATCGDGVVDSDEECDDGNSNPRDSCDHTCSIVDTGGCGCAVGARDSGLDAGPIIWLMGAAFWLVRRRRRRRRSKRR